MIHGAVDDVIQHVAILSQGRIGLGQDGQGSKARAKVVRNCRAPEARGFEENITAQADVRSVSGFIVRGGDPKRVRVSSYHMFIPAMKSALIIRNEWIQRVFMRIRLNI